ncbi:MAG: FHIPEP family type III secretion protein [Planctomycetales bacterium]|nr:FHIPEP family type III secretion protein [Planctomycetales bacterium]
MLGDGSNNGFANRSELLLSLALLGVLFVLLVPLPPVLLDMLLALNLGVSIVLLLITLGVRQPLEISVFPSLLLLLTLYRLSLNVATTRLILSGGDAGRIVATFGNFVVGGNLVVGMVIFLILVVIQFIVITKGAGRVSEVAARFTLDALPGKQMAIDAELSSGAIDEVAARARRDTLAREAEFYGAMDGASKFVRGDAIAGLLVTGVNLLGGVILGAMGGLTLAEAASQYSELTIGDGLVSQIPALIVAVTSGVLVTKAGSSQSLGHEISSQLTSNLRPLSAGAMILCIVALAPGLPKLPFLMLAAGLAVTVRSLSGAEEEEQTDESPAPPAREEADPTEGFLQTERICVEIGARLIPLVESGQQTKGLAERISSLRRELTRKHGLWVPAVRIRDNIQLTPDAYRVLIGGREVARGELRPDRQLAISTGNPTIELRGEETLDPAFGLKAFWIDAGERARADLAGYTVVDVGSVLITHLGEVLRLHAHELLSRDDLMTLLDQLRTTSPAIVDELKADSLRTAVVHQVLLLLLEEQVPIIDLASILEAVLNHAARTKEPDELVEWARRALGRTICDRFRDAHGRVRVAVIEPRLEQDLQEAMRDGMLSLTTARLERLIARCSESWQKAQNEGAQLALLTDGRLRRAMRKTLWRALPDLAVISYPEVPRDIRIDPQAMLRWDDIWQPQAGDAEAANNLMGAGTRGAEL